MNYLKIITLSLLLCSCGNNSTEHVEKSTTNMASFKDVDGTIATQLNQLTQQYLHLKNGMVASNNAEAKAGAKGILDAVVTIDTLKLTSAQKPIFIAQIETIRANAKHILDSDDIDRQREYLNSLSQSIYHLAKSFGSKQTLYYAFCPMANNSNGGYWVSETEEIKNPYFGDNMLTCGEVNETIK